MRSLDEISFMQEQMNEEAENTEKKMKISRKRMELAEQTICDLRDLLTFMKGYKQIIDVKHPEAKAFEHWEEMNSDMDAMAMRLLTYEKQLHRGKKSVVA